MSKKCPQTVSQFRFSQHALCQQDAYRTIQRRATAAGIQTRIGNHTFRATGITAYLKNGGTLETAQQMAAHESPRATGLYDRRSDVSLDEVERIGIWAPPHPDSPLLADAAWCAQIWWAAVATGLNLGCV